jgi:hypothetical protein
MRRPTTAPRWSAGEAPPQVPVRFAPGLITEGASRDEPGKPVLRRAATARAGSRKPKIGPRQASQACGASRRSISLSGEVEKGTKGASRRPQDQNPGRRSFGCLTIKVEVVRSFARRSNPVSRERCSAQRCCAIAGPRFLRTDSNRDPGSAAHRSALRPGHGKLSALFFPSRFTPILSVPASRPAMAINGRRNKPFGPGGGTRRLHRCSSDARLPCNDGAGPCESLDYGAASAGANQDRRGCKGRAFARYGSAVIGPQQ